MVLTLRSAGQHDAPEMARILNEIIAIGGTTAHDRSFDTHRVIETFVAAKLGISCFVAMEKSRLLSFQALEWCDPEWPGGERLPVDWAVVATYVDLQAQGHGVGRALFVETEKAAKAAGVRFIDATIRTENSGGRAFYRSIGFTDFRTGAETVSKRFAPN